MRASVMQEDTEVFWSSHCFEVMARRASTAPQLGSEDAEMQLGLLESIQPLQWAPRSQISTWMPGSVTRGSSGHGLIC